MPSEERKDGVFFFVLKKRLYIWPKASMDAGVIQLLDKAALLDDGTKAELRRRGIEALLQRSSTRAFCHRRGWDY